MTAALLYQPQGMNYFYKTRHTFAYLGLFIGVPFVLGQLHYYLKDVSQFDELAFVLADWAVSNESRMANSIEAIR